MDLGAVVSEGGRHYEDVSLAVVHALLRFRAAPLSTLNRWALLTLWWPTPFLFSINHAPGAHTQRRLLSDNGDSRPL